MLKKLSTNIFFEIIYVNKIWKTSMFSYREMVVNIVHLFGLALIFYEAFVSPQVFMIMRHLYHSKSLLKHKAVIMNM